MRRTVGVRYWPALFGAALIAGCAADTSNGAQTSGGTAEVGCVPGAPGCVPAAGGLNGTGGSSSMLPTTGNTNTGTPTSTDEGVPCDVASVVSNNCTTCHAATPHFSAPMPLMKLSDFHAPAKSDPTQQVYQIIPTRINAQQVARRMPPASQSALSAPDLQVLNTWLSAGAQGGGQTCAITEPGTMNPTTTPGDNTGDNGGTAGAGDNTTMMTTNPGGSGGSSDQPIEYNDPEMKCYQFLAHDPSDKLTPYSVSTTPDQYTNFTFMPEWTGMMYVRSFHVIIGNMNVIHHWLFYKDSTAGPDGDVSPSSGAHPNGELMHGWAPGGSDLYFDPDVGEEMPGDVAYTLETHHNNTTGGPAPDASGIEVCVTPKVPANVASLSWLGTDGINGTMASGTCVPTATEPIHILGGTPHMHLKGSHMTVIVNRADGTQETQHDADFDFGYQHSYNEPNTIMPGDTITTTCFYSSPASFGEGTNDEMCYYFTLYYPKLSLTSANPISTLIHGANNCL